MAYDIFKCRDVCVCVCKKGFEENDKILIECLSEEAMVNFLRVLKK